MASVRRSLLHVDFFIKRKKKKKAKRRNTIAEGDNKELQEVLKKCQQQQQQAASLVDSSCQTDLDSDPPKSTSQIFKRFSFRRDTSAEKNNNQSKRRSLPLANKSEDNGLYQTVDLKLSSKFSKKKPRSVEASPDKGKEKTAEVSTSTSSKKAAEQPKKSKAKSYLPISTLSAAMSVAVKMRQSLKKGADDGRSSSGNWSASSSTRASVDSSDQQAGPAQSSNPGSPTDSSIDKDSMLSDTQDTESRLHDFTSDTSTRTASDSTTTAAVSSSSKRPSSLSLQQLQTNDWVKKLDPSNTSSSTQENYFSDTSTPLVRSPYARRKKDSGEPSPPRLDDEESSVYSIDTDGYYTSMHTDSGLKNKVAQSSPEKEPCNFRSRKDSDCSTLDTISLNSLLSRTATEISSRSNSLTRDKRGPPPQPPQRISSIKLPPANNSKEISPAQAGDVSESEPECRERLRQKTSINSSRYPSMCVVSPEPSDEDDSTTKSNTPKNSEDLNATSDSMNSLESARFIDEPDRKKEDVNMYDKSSKNACVVRNPPSRRNGKDSSCRNTVIFIPDPQHKDASTPKEETDTNQNKVKMPNLTDFSSLSNDSRASSKANSREHLSSASSTTSSSSPSSPSSKSDSSPVLPPPMPLVDAVYKSFSSLSSKNGYSFKYSSLRRDSSTGSQAISSPTSATNSLSRTSTPTSLQSTMVKSSTIPTLNSKPVARVTLDPNGKVIYSSNSLGRRRDGQPLTNGTPSFSPEPRFATLPLPSTNFAQTTNPTITTTQSQTQLKSQRPVTSNPPVQVVPSSFQRNTPTRSTLPKNFSVPAMSPAVPTNHVNGSYGPAMTNHSSTASLPHATSSYNRFGHLPQHQVSTPIQQRSYTPDPTTSRNNFYTFSKPVTPTSQGYSTSNFNPHRPTSRSTPSPIPHYNRGPQYGTKPAQNRQFFTPPSTPLTPQPGGVMKPSPTFPPASKSLTPPQQGRSQNTTPSSSPGSPNKTNNPGKSMSSADLYAIIHNSKKKLNIKSEMDQTISPHSSRSGSPPSSIGRPATPNRNGLAETGFLTPRAELTNSQKRRSWVGDGSPSLFTPGERRSLAQDRLGPSKPTSIHDFKMLLLHAKTSGGSGISAAERLKSTPRSRSDSPAVSPTTPAQPARVNGNVGPPVPAKRTPRAKYNLQTRYDLKCEPILEDTTEDSKFLSKNTVHASNSSSTWV